MITQKTIAKEICIKGKGIHTGYETTLCFKPAEKNTGFVFIRSDLNERPQIPALADYVFDTSRGTSLKNGEAIVRTVEHVLAAVVGCDIDNIIIELDHEETPIMDGSSRYFTEALLSAGIKEQDAERIVYTIDSQCYLKDEEKDVEMYLIPDKEFRITTMIDYNNKVLGTQNANLRTIREFNDNFSAARTFVFLSEVQTLLKHNLIQGGDIKNAIVFVDKILSQEELDNLAKVFNQPRVSVLEEGILNNVELVYPNEPARHKTLDVLGDLALVGLRFTGHIMANKPGHKTNVEFAKFIRNEIEQNYGNTNISH